MSYISLYRKYRSQNFDEVIGQDVIIQTLKNAVSKGRLSHAYLFTGPRGTGKTSTARILAKALNCEKGPTPNPCGKCVHCERIRDGHSVDIIEIDAASNRGIDEIRELRERVKYAPVEGRYKVYIIDEVHMLTTEAFNALLKTLEEPPSHTIFVLATTEPVKVPLTISSRCQQFEFGRIKLECIVEHLKKVAKSEGFSIDEQATNLIARTAEGSMRDAISLLDQLVSFCGNKITFDDVVTLLGTADEELLFSFAEAIAKGDVKTGLDLVGRAVLQGRSIPQVTKDLLGHFRHILLIKVGVEGVIELTKDYLERLKRQVEFFSLETIKETLRILSRAETDMKWHPQSRLVLEVAIVEAAELGGKKTVELKKESPKLLSKVESNWHNILESVKKKSIGSYVSLHEGTPIELGKDGKLVISFRKGFGFHKERLEEEANMKAVEASIKEIVGEEVKLKCVVSETTEGVEGERALSVETVKNFFEGKVIS